MSITNVTDAPAPGRISPSSASTGPVAEESGTQLSRPAARAAAVLRIALGLVYLWAFVSQGFGIVYSNRPAPPPGAPPSAAFAIPPDGNWHFSYQPDRGFISSGFSASPTEGYLRANSRGPLAVIPESLPPKANDLLWIFAVGGLGIALTLGIFSKAAGWGGLALNILMWFSAFPPERNPVLDGEHMIFGLVTLTLLYIGAADHWGLGRWWKARTPAVLH
jgi:thiosulfate dehydrogenase [quinone] large subunit